MHITEVPTDSHETVLRVEAPDIDLLGFIAIHSTARGPAAGGLRMRPYDTENDALRDVLNLSRGMTYKNAAADLPLGGGKAVIVGNPARKTEAQLRGMGRAIETLGGRYWTAEDMGMTPAALAHLRQETRYVAGLDTGGHASGDPSPVTASGVFRSLRVTCRHTFGGDGLSERSVAIQGLGNVGWHLAQHLSDAGAHLVVADIDEDRIAKAVASFGATALTGDALLAASADILSPCAIGGVLNAETIPALQVRAICGAANNQLADPGDADRLHERGILYAPDYVANAGGIINVATEILGIDDRDAYVDARLDAIESTLDTILSRATAENRSPDAIALELVNARIA